MPKKKSKSFQELQEHWYGVLKKEGFEDIENTHKKERLLNRWHGFYFYTRYSAVEYDAKQEYFRQAGQFLYDHTFEKAEEKRVWELHCQGLSCREISEIVGINKDYVNWIILDLQEVMKRSHYGKED